MKNINLYLYFNGNCEEAFKFYQNVFGGNLQIVRYKDLENDMNAAGEDRDKIANIRLPLNDNTVLLGSDALESFGPQRKIGNNFYINLEIEDKEQVERIFNALSSDGKVEMPLQKTEWAEKFGNCADKFGVQWMVMYTCEQS
jgi:PhnB protein